MRSLNVKIGFLLIAIFFYACTKPSISKKDDAQSVGGVSSTAVSAAGGLQCTAQAEQTDYSIFKMCNDGTRIGDVTPFYDASAGNFKIYYLKDVWSATGARHPWYAFATSNFYNYAETGQIVGSSTAQCAQDNAVGAGSLVKSGSTYYAFYTGHNPNTTGCTNGVKREGVMLATSTNPAAGFTKNTSFATIYTPQGIGYDEADNWRDPFVIWDAQNNNWMMIITARKNHNGSWRGVLAKYTSTNLLNWTYQGVFYDGGNKNFFNMECAELFQMGSNYYLLFSDQNIGDEKQRYVIYRKSTSLNGPWSQPTGSDRLDGNEFYAAKTAVDGYGDRYFFGWNLVLSGNTDAGSRGWGGNLVVHKMYAAANGDLAVAIPHTVKNWLETNTYGIVKNSQWGNVTNTPGTQSYRIISNANMDVANVIFEPIDKPQYMITATVSYTSSSKDFGFMIGACDGYENIYQLRFVPAENKFKFEKKVRSALDNNPENDIPITLSPNTNYKVQIVIENSVVVVYINDKIALTNRIYKASNTNWGIFTDNSDATFTNITVTHP